MKNERRTRNCFLENGKFAVGVHRPIYEAVNLRISNSLITIGISDEGKKIYNQENYPPEEKLRCSGSWVYEIPNAFDFRGTTYIGKEWADKKVNRHEHFLLPPPEKVSYTECLLKNRKKGTIEIGELRKEIAKLPSPLRLALAKTSTDHRDLIALSHISCRLVSDRSKTVGLYFKVNSSGQTLPVIEDPELFEVVVNNPYLPDEYKTAMVLNPGIQGNSPVIGEFSDVQSSSHIWEYLRTNSYIPWGHYAANMAHDSIRYRASDLSLSDISGLRHIYYQRVYVALSHELGILPSTIKSPLSSENLEELRIHIVHHLEDQKTMGAFPFSSTLWGWNYGFDYSSTGYRLGASHQQIHQQFALIPKEAFSPKDAELKFHSFSIGDLVNKSITDFNEENNGSFFFTAYEKALRNNDRTDSLKTGEKSLIVFENEQVVLFVPKAQTSQYEIQIMTKSPSGNILETSTSVRKSIDTAITIAIRLLSKMGIQMATVVEYSKRFDILEKEQRLMYFFLPRMPFSPGGFSEAQLRWISGHYPEDFAAALRYYLNECDLI